MFAQQAVEYKTSNWSRSCKTARFQHHERSVIAVSLKQDSLLVRGMGAFAVVLVVLLAVGTFADWQIAQAVYDPGNPLITFVSTLGLVPLAYPACLFLGVLMQRCLASHKPLALRIAGAVLCAVLVVLFGGLVTRSLLSARDGFGGLVGTELSTFVRLGIGGLVGAGLCALGFGAGKANDAKDLARRVLIVVVVLAVSYLVVEVLKNVMARPRPRVLLAGYSGIEFSPWYQKSAGAEGFMAAFGLEKDAFKSFPSGHSVQVAALLTSFYGLSIVYPSLRQKLGVALAVEVVFALVVMACRMVLGAHFLSDVSVGALVSVIAFLVMMALQRPDQKTGQRGSLSDEA